MASPPFSSSGDDSSSSPCPAWMRRSRIRRENAKPCKFQDWQRKWFVGDRDSVKQLRATYEQSYRRYFGAYQLGEEDFCYWQEQGMKYFQRMERSAIRQSRLQRYHLRAQASLHQLWVNLCNEERHAMPILVAIDFEGVSHMKKGVNAFGMTTLDFPSLVTTNYGLNCSHRDQNCLFSNTIGTTPELLPRWIINSFESISSEGRDIVLVGQGIYNELSVLDSLQISLEDLPIAGVVDTVTVAREVLGRGVSLRLRNLIEMLGIEARHDSLHCAGNDTHYTLQVLLALLQKKYGELACVEEIIRKSPPTQRPSTRTSSDFDVDWDEHLDGGWGFL